MPSHFIQYLSSSVHYALFGSGEKWLVCLHGYGESAESFLFLEPAIQEQYTCVAIDFPFHGKTNWQEGNTLMPAQWIEIIDLILAKHGQKNACFSLLAFSMGGRIALHMLTQVPSRIRKTVLVAPDGMRMNPWYWLATQTRAGNRLFRYTMENPYWFFGMMKMANKATLINRSIFKFAHHYLDDAIVRKDLYRRWTCMRFFTPALSTIKTNIATYQIPVRLLYGEYDRIIQHANAGKLLNGMKPLVTLTVISSGHQLLRAKHTEQVLQLLNH